MDVNITAGAISAAYGLAYLGCARALYHHWRETSAQRLAYRHTCEIHTAGLEKNSYRRSECCFNDKRNRTAAPNGWLAFFAILVAWFWPVAVLVWFVRWNPPMTSPEIKAMEEEIRADRARLDQELAAYREKELEGLREERNG